VIRYPFNGPGSLVHGPGISLSYRMTHVVIDITFGIKPTRNGLDFYIRYFTHRVFS